MQREPASAMRIPTMDCVDPSAPTPRVQVPIRNTFVHFDLGFGLEGCVLRRVLTWPLGPKDTYYTSADVASADEGSRSNHSSSNNNSSLTSSSSMLPLRCLMRRWSRALIPRLGESQRLQASRAMACVLRHKANAFGLNLRPDGFLPVVQLLACPALRPFDCTIRDVRRIVDSDLKQRFQLAEVDGLKQVRASQGHSMAGVRDEALLRILDSDAVPEQCVHGTYMKHWNAICERGLMAGGALGTKHRRHVHFARGLLGTGGVISGMRSDCEVAIYLDVRASQRAGLPFFESNNGVILTPGFDGLVPTRLFHRAVCLRTGAELWPLPSEDGGREHRRVVPPSSGLTAQELVPSAPSSGAPPVGEMLVGRTREDARTKDERRGDEVVVYGGGVGDVSEQASGSEGGEVSRQIGVLENSSGEDADAKSWTIVCKTRSRQKEAGRQAAEKAQTSIIDMKPMASPAEPSSRTWRGSSRQDVSTGKDKVCSFVCCLRVGIQEEASFRVVRRLLGTGGENVRFIVSEARGNACVAVRGQGVRGNGEKHSEAVGPLAIWVSASNQQNFERAASLAEDLLADVQEAYRGFCQRGGRPVPALRVSREMRSCVGAPRVARVGDAGLGQKPPQRRLARPQASATCPSAEHRCRPELPPRSATEQRGRQKHAAHRLGGRSGDQGQQGS